MQTEVKDPQARLDQAALSSELKQLECRTIQQGSSCVCWMLPGSKFAFYLQAQKQQAQLVLPPALEVFRDLLVAVPGVISQYDYYHNNEMTRFPTHAHGRQKAAHYGLAFEFSSAAAVSGFIQQLNAIIRQ